MPPTVPSRPPAGGDGHEEPRDRAWQPGGAHRQPEARRLQQGAAGAGQAQAPGLRADQK